MNLESIGELLASLWTVWALLVFTGILGWALWPGNRKRFERDARIPLKDDC